METNDLRCTIHSAARELGGFGSAGKAFELIGVVAGAAKIAELTRALDAIEQERERWNGPENGDMRMRHSLGKQAKVVRAAIALRSAVKGF